MSILIAPQVIASYETGLCQGFRELGKKADLILMSENPYSRQLISEKPSKGERIAGDFRVLNAALRVNYFSNFGVQYATRAITITRRAFALRILIWSLRKTDTYIFSYGNSFFHLKELPILRMMGKKIFAVMHGSDVRPACMNAGWPENIDEAVEFVAQTSRNQVRTMRTLERWCTGIVNRPVHGQFHRKPFINHFHLGNPVSVGQIDNVTTAINANGTNGPVRILHAPSCPLLKGTPLIRQVVDELKAEDLNIEYNEITNRPNADVLEAIAQCDFVLDGAFSDIPLGILGTEAAFMGKPAIVGSMATKEVQRFTQGTGIPTECFVPPEGIKDAARRLIIDADFRRSHGENLKAFVTTNWTPKMVAEKWLKVIRQKQPKEWMVNPKDIQYVWGYGDPAAIRNMVRETYKRKGIKSFGLGHRPDLEQQLIAIAEAP